jgi:glutathione S-transferase
MTTPVLTLYSDTNFYSPYVMSAFVALTEKGLPFELVTLDLAQGEHLREPYKSLSLTRRVPTLTNGTFLLSESSAIAEYLDELFPAPTFTALYPQHIEQRAKAREVQAWLRSDLGPLREERSTAVVFGGVRCPPLTPAGQAAADKLVVGAQQLLGDNDYLFTHWSIADSDLALMLNRLLFNGDKLPEKLEQYAKAQWQRPSVKAWLALSLPD